MGKSGDSLHPFKAQRMTAAQQLRAKLADGDLHLAVSAYDGLSARLADAAGFELIALGGYGAAAALAGLPDIGLVSMTEMVDTCRRMCETVDRPIIADADTGYGGPLAVARATRAFEAAGAAALQIEDQTSPKRCGLMAGKTVVPVNEMVAKIVAAVGARRDDAFVVIARTDALTVHGIDDALARARAYRAAGADVILIEGPQSETDVSRIARALPRPLAIPWDTQGPLLPRRTLTDLGYAVAVFPDTPFAVHATLVRLYATLRDAETLDTLAQTIPMTAFAEFNASMRLDALRNFESACSSSPPVPTANATLH